MIDNIHINRIAVISLAPAAPAAPGPCCAFQDSSKVGAVETGCSDLYDVIY